MTEPNEVITICACGRPGCRDGDSSFSKSAEQCAADSWAVSLRPYAETAKHALMTKDRDHLLLLAVSADPFIRAQVAMNSETPSRTLEALRREDNISVRAALQIRDDLSRS